MIPFYLLDTNIISEMVKPVPNEKVVNKIMENIHHCGISVATWQELLTGMKMLPQGRKRDILEDFYMNYVKENFNIIEYKVFDAEIYSDFVAKCKEFGIPCHYSDTQIAATAKANGMILVTRNTKDFQAFEKHFNLAVENWF